MISMTTSEARKDLAKVVQQVRQGEEVIISRHERPAVAIIGIKTLRRYRAMEKRINQAASRETSRLEELQAEVREITQDIADAEAALAEEGRISLEDLMAELA